MRSRYSAFVRGDREHLLASWHPSTRPATLELDPALAWTGLTVLRTERGGLLDDDGVVEFRAGWTSPDGVGAVHEVSRFQREGRHWYYLDGLLR